MNMLSKAGSSRQANLEILAGIPSVVYGFFAFIYIGPIVVSIGEFALETDGLTSPEYFESYQRSIGSWSHDSSSCCLYVEDALRAVPNELREDLALGATSETTLRVMIQASLSGILASIILALSRAVGETMAVTRRWGQLLFTSNMFRQPKR